LTVEIVRDIKTGFMF